MDYISLGKLALWHHPVPGSSNGTPRGRVVLVHGICEHSGRHLNTINALGEFGYEVVRFDLRGSGQSGGRPQYIERFSDYTDDLHAVFGWAQSQLPTLPTFLMGHSLGGAIALHGSLPIQKLLKGLILSAPAFLTGSAISPAKIRVGRFINRVYPAFRIPGSSDHGSISRIPEVVESYYLDPLSFHFNTVRQGDEILKALDKIPEIIPQLKLPVLLAHGTHDRLIRVEGSFEILRGLGSRDRTLVLIPGGYHELHNDLCQKEFFQQLKFWADAHCESVKTEEVVNARRPWNDLMTKRPRPRPQ